MESLGSSLTELEQRYYGELFSTFDVDNQGKVSGIKALDLLNCSQLPADVVEQIVELCGAARLGHFGRSQFYIALKLVAAAQMSQPLTAESLKKAIPLPQFTPGFKSSSSPEADTQQKGQIQKSPLKQQLSNEYNGSNRVTGQLPPPPAKANTRGKSRQGSLNKGGEQSLSSVEASPAHQSYSGNRSLPENNDRITSRKDSQSPSSDEPSSPNTVAPTDKNWASFGGVRKMVGASVQGNGDAPVNWTHFDEGRRLVDYDDERSNTSDEETTDVWVISDEQRAYYRRQFTSMQPNCGGKLRGSVAKEFFEMSRLPSIELSKIWKLSDLDKDGALTLGEFCVAMHLVVLRRNKVDLPEVLPPLLRASAVPEKAVPANSCHEQPTGDKLRPMLNPALSPQSKQWTKFSDSPTSVLLNLTSPPEPPLNFGFNADCIERDPQIVHPVPVRVSPEGQILAPPSFISAEIQTFLPTNNSVKRIPTSRPEIEPKEEQRVPVVLSHKSSGAPVPGTGAPKNPPPPPPPRPSRRSGHARSSSLDLNRLGKTFPEVAVLHSAAPLPSRPELPHPLPSSNASFSPSASGTASLISAGHHGAFSVYKKPQTFSSTSPLTDSHRIDQLMVKYSVPPAVPEPSDASDPLELLRAVKALQDRGHFLEQINCDLMHELKRAIESNVRLEADLVQIRSSNM